MLPVYHLEDFHQLTDIDINSFFLKSISKIANCCDFEICGAATKDKLYFFKNLSKNPQETFIVDPSEYVLFYNEIKFFFHSHCLGGAKPSGADIEMATELGKPFLIYSNIEKNFSFYSPKNKKSIYFSL